MIERASKFTSARMIMQWRYTAPIEPCASRQIFSPGVSDPGRFFTNECTQTMPQYTISGWVSLADQFFAGAVKAVTV